MTVRHSFFVNNDMSFGYLLNTIMTAFRPSFASHMGRVFIVMAVCFTIVAFIYRVFFKENFDADHYSILKRQVTRGIFHPVSLGNITSLIYPMPFSSVIFP